ncbi:CotH kinase family protein, partial [archaeon]
GTRLLYEYPRPDRITGAQEEWIKGYMEEFEEAVVQGRHEEYIDVDSFVDYYLINELFKDLDAFRSSTYITKDRGGKLVMGPIWDYDTAMGNRVHYGVWNTSGWVLGSFQPRTSPVPFWWKMLLKDPGFANKTIERWKELRRGPLSAENINAEIDGAALLLDEAQERNFERWLVLGEYVWPNPEPYPETYEGEVEALRAWLVARAEWIDGNIESLA